MKIMEIIILQLRKKLKRKRTPKKIEQDSNIYENLDIILDINNFINKLEFL